MGYVFAAPPQAVVPVDGGNDLFPVHRIYCVGRNYADHAKGMGFSCRTAPAGQHRPAWRRKMGHSARFAASGAVMSAPLLPIATTSSETIEHLSKFFELRAGDLIYTGTPEGVGAVMRGDELDGGIERIGALKVRVV